MNSILKAVATIGFAVIGLAILGHLTEHAQATAPGAPEATGHQIIDSDTRLIQQGQFYVSEFTLTRPAKITISVQLKDGLPIDCYFVAEQGLNAWQAMTKVAQNFRFSYRPELSMAPLVGSYTHTAWVQPGKHAFIIDNSKAGATAPPFHFFRMIPALVAFTVSAD